MQKIFDQRYIWSGKVPMAYLARMAKFQVPQKGQTESFRVRTREIDRDHQLSPIGMLGLLHEASMDNILRLKLSVWDLEHRHLSWVLFRQYLEVDQWPELRDSVLVQTYPSGLRRLFTYRDFRVLNAAEEEIARSSSQWLLLDTRTRKPVPIPEDILAVIEPFPEEAICLPPPAFKLRPLQESVPGLQFEVLRHHLDWNDHLNNMHYVRWQLVAMPDAVYNTHQLARLELEYKHEVFKGEQLIASAQRAPDGSYLHQLYRPADQAVVAMSRSWWKPKTKL